MTTSPDVVVASSDEDSDCVAAVDVDSGDEEYVPLMPHHDFLRWIAHFDGTIEDDFMGVFDTSVVRIAQLRGYRAPLGFDLKSGHNLLSWEARSVVLRTLESRRPKCLVLAPPCTMFCALMKMWCFAKMSEAERTRRMTEACVLFDFAVLCAKVQLLGGRLFLLEQPASASSLKRLSVAELKTNAGVALSMFDMCRFDLRSPLGTPIRKHTCFVSNSINTHALFHKKGCNGHHAVHLRIQGSEAGQRLSTWCQNYPRALCEGIIATSMASSNVVDLS